MFISPNCCWIIKWLFVSVWISLTSGEVLLVGKSLPVLIPVPHFVSEFPGWCLISESSSPIFGITNMRWYLLRLVTHFREQWTRGAWEDHSERNQPGIPGATGLKLWPCSNTVCLQVITISKRKNIVFVYRELFELFAFDFSIILNFAFCIKNHEWWDLLAEFFGK